MQPLQISAEPRGLQVQARIDERGRVVGARISLQCVLRPPGGGDAAITAEVPFVDDAEIRAQLEVLLFLLRERAGLAHVEE